MTDKENQEVTVAVLKEQVRVLTEIVEGLQKDRDSAFRWGIATLGAAVLGLATIAFNFYNATLKHV